MALLPLNRRGNERMHRVADLPIPDLLPRQRFRPPIWRRGPPENPIISGMRCKETMVIEMIQIVVKDAFKSFRIDSS